MECKNLSCTCDVAIYTVQLRYQSSSEIYRNDSALELAYDESFVANQQSDFVFSLDDIPEQRENMNDWLWFSSYPTVSCCTYTPSSYLCIHNPYVYLLC